MINEPKIQIYLNLIFSRLRLFFFQDGFAGKFYLVAFLADTFDHNLLSFFEFVAHVFDAAVGNFGNVQKPVQARKNFDKRAEIYDAVDRSEISFSDLGFGGDGAALELESSSVSSSALALATSVVSVSSSALVSSLELAFPSVFPSVSALAYWSVSVFPSVLVSVCSSVSAFPSAYLSAFPSVSALAYSFYAESKIKMGFPPNRATRISENRRRL
jgi:hypothetical protein